MRNIGIGIVVALALAACGKGDDKGGKGGDPLASKGTEAKLQLDQIGKQSKKYFYAHDNVFPQMDTGLTPAKACCDQPDHVCAPSASDWEVGSAAPTTWGVLRFKMTDKPFRAQYSFKSDGKTFTATAVVDPECDGHPVTYTLNGRVTGGEPTTTLVEP